MEERIRQLERIVSELIQKEERRKRQQISYPLDQSSKNAVFEGTEIPVSEGNGSSPLTQSVNIPSTPTTISVPRAYADTVLLNFGGTIYEVPYL